MVFDFLDIKPIVREVCDSLDHKLLLPGENLRLEIQTQDKNYEVKTPDNSIDILTKTRVIALFENNLRVLHPFMPFLTEELWHFCGTRTPNEALVISQWPTPAPFDKKLLDDFDQIQQLIGAVRKFRKEKNIGFKAAIQLHVINDKTPWNQYE